MRQKVPFYSNTSDDMHCFQAVFRMVLKFFLPEKDLSWRELDKMTAKKKNLWTWPMQGLLNLKKMGFEIVQIEDFDYEKFSREGEKYLVKELGREVGEAQIKHSDIQ